MSSSRSIVWRRNRIAEDRDGDSGLGDRLVQLPEMAVDQRIAAGQADLRRYAATAAKGLKISSTARACGRSSSRRSERS